MAVQKFPTTRGWVVRELLNQSHDLQVYDSSVPYEPEVRKRDCRTVCANFGFGTLVSSLKSGARAPQAASRGLIRVADSDERDYEGPVPRVLRLEEGGGHEA